jgi:hypothetical protein
MALFKLFFLGGCVVVHVWLGSAGVHGTRNNLQQHQHGINYFTSCYYYDPSHSDFSLIAYSTVSILMLLLPHLAPC